MAGTAANSKLYRFLRLFVTLCRGDAKIDRYEIANIRDMSTECKHISE